MTEELNVLLARVDERTASMVRDMAELRQKMVTQAEFKPIRMIAYGLIAMITTSVVGAILSLVLQAHG